MSYCKHNRAITAGTSDGSNKVAVKLTPAIAVKSLKTVLPLAEKALLLVEKNGGRSHLPLGVRHRMKQVGIETWAEHYLDTRTITALSLLGTYSIKQMEEIGEMLRSSDDETRQKFFNDLIVYLSTDNWIDEAVEAELDGLTVEEMQREFEEILEVVDEDTKRDISGAVYGSLLSAITTIYNTIAVMAYGQTLARLIQKAVDGDMNAYFRAYHVDDSIAELPVFAALHEEKKQQLKGNFFNALSERRRKAVLPGEIKYPTLWFVFAYLDSARVLPSKEGGGLSMEELMQVCVELKVYGHEYDKGVDDLSKRLQDYRKRQLTKI